MEDAKDSGRALNYLVEQHVMARAKPAVLNTFRVQPPPTLRIGT
jgi:hypothetical protein